MFLPTPFSWNVRLPSPSGFEVPTPRCTSPSVKADLSAGGDDGVRTHDPLLAGQVLSQLSYTPVSGSLSLFQRSLKLSLADP